MAASAEVQRKMAGLFAGRELSAVTFVMDYVQLQFQASPPSINALTRMTVRSQGKVIRTGEDQFRNALCGQIRKVVSNIAIHDEKSFDVAFMDGSVISISLEPEHYVGPEAVNVYGDGDFCLVI